MNMTQTALEMRTALQYFVASLDAETQLDLMLEIPSVYPAYAVGKAYKTKDVFSYGINAVGDPQLYQVLQDHTSAAEWTPDTAVSLYKAIGVTETGYPVWVQPLGATDAYNTGDIVSYNGALYISTIDGNVWSPEAYPAGWKAYAE
ncbi:MAG: hypothetical protein IKL47_06090 [Clostridia bacterium]|nr:hypothetical protein [Clostridia bacterium]